MTGPHSLGALCVLWGISAISTTDIWAVGGLYGVGGLAENWNGKAWQRVQAPRYQQLGAVAAVAPADVWAVGARGDGCTSLPVIEHWNGQQWANVATRTTPGPGLGNLYSVSAASPSDIWAVGTFTPHGTLCGGPIPPKRLQRTRPLISHWNGHQWLVSEASPQGMGSSFESVAALSPTNVWAAGNESVPDNGSRTLIEHWNGRTWSIVPGTVDAGWLLSVAAESPRQAWAIGEQSAPYRPSIQRWNGSVWSESPTPFIGGNNILTSIAASSASNAWAVGGDLLAQTAGRSLEPIPIEHWDGKSWSAVIGPAPSW